MNLKAFMSAIKEVPEFLPLIDQTVQQVEAALAGIPGAQKLAAVEAKINGYLATFESDVAVIADLKTILTPLINIAVAAFNAANVFKHGTVQPS